MSRPPVVLRISPLGDAALTVSFADRLDDEARDQVLGLADRLTRRADPAIVELVPAYVSLVVRYRPDLLDYATIRALVADHLGGAAPRLAPGRLIEIPVHYDGPDLDAVAGGTGLTAAEVIALHCGREYSVSLLGFVPGFAYLTELDPRLVLPRRAAPRPRVPAGSVAIAGEQTGIYPAETPGGWHLIGRTPLRVFDPAREPPSLFAVGDRVRFVPTAP